MMAVYPLPSDLIISDVKIDHFTPQFVTQSLNLKRRSKDRDLHQLRGTFNIKIVGERQQRQFESWLGKMKGRLNQFEINLGGRFAVPRSRLQEPRTSTLANVGSNEIILSAFTGQIWEGDFLKLPNDNKVYMALNDVTGSGTLNIMPSLRQSQQPNTQLTMNEVTIIAMLDDDNQSITYSEGGIITDFTCAWKEYV